MIDSPLPHLDHVFDYAVPARRSTPRRSSGARVRVRFAGRLTDGFVVGRLDDAEHAGDAASRSSGSSASSRC